jgi:hypothetical protein
LRLDSSFQACSKPPLPFLSSELSPVTAPPPPPHARVRQRHSGAGDDAQAQARRWQQQRSVTGVTTAVQEQDGARARASQHKSETVLGHGQHSTRARRCSGMGNTAGSGGGTAGDSKAHEKRCSSHYSDPSHLGMHCIELYLPVGLQFAAAAVHTLYLQFCSV